MKQKLAKSNFSKNSTFNHLCEQDRFTTRIIYLGVKYQCHDCYGYHKRDQSYQKISFNEYKRRMENFLLEQIYISGEFEKTLKQFISDARDEGNDDHKQEKSSESEEDGKSKNFEENSSVDEQKTKNSYLWDQEPDGAQYRKIQNSY